jgi:hypothetical protein
MQQVLGISMLAPKSRAYFATIYQPQQLIIEDFEHKTGVSVI